MVKSFDDIDKMIRSMTVNKRIVMAVAAADDEHVLEAVCAARDLGLIDAILVGDKQKILQIALENSLELKDFEIVDCQDAHLAAVLAVDLVRCGQAQILMKGLLETSVLIKAVLDKERGLHDKRLLSFVGLFEVKKFGKMIGITDPAINLEPGLDDKEIIMKNAVALFHALGNDCPNVAFVAPIEKVNQRMDSTMHARALSEKYRDSKDFHCDGPFALDNAVSVNAAKIKGLSGPVAGNADILITNDIGVGNAIYKALVHFSDTRNAGIVIGARAPIIMTSRADSTDAKINSIKLGVLLSEYYHALSN
jgi:phosphate butyryltransferase